ncbi:MAG: NifB/NifX family molybdenum-iron cluster-binding protein [Desulfovibrionaceae bacterium]
MSTKMLIAVPSNAPGGLDASPSAHFGHCDVYTIATVNDGKVEEVHVHPNSGHDHGNCLAPVLELAQQGVRVLIAGGMGMNPLRGLQEAGIQVYYSAGMENVGSIIAAFAAGSLQPFGTDNLCKGGCSHH